jgi:hypothetical protein
MFDSFARSAGLSSMAALGPRMRAIRVMSLIIAEVFSGLIS